MICEYSGDVNDITRSSPHDLPHATYVDRLKKLVNDRFEDDVFPVGREAYYKDDPAPKVSHPFPPLVDSFKSCSQFHTFLSYL
jgi:hypothetical protein